jgi:hypothetical protein
VHHRSGDEGIDELWGEPFRAFSIPIEDFYESRYIKIGQSMRDIERIAEAMKSTFSHVPAFQNIEPLITDFVGAALIKTENLRTDPDIFDVWARLVTASERLVNFVPQTHRIETESPKHSISNGLQLIRNGRDLIFYIARARTPMPKSMKEYLDHCEAYLLTGRLPSVSPPPPA